jgi:voltage-gated potassium channel
MMALPKSSPPLERLRHTLLLLTLVVLAGALGYHFLAKLNYLDSFYMAITTLFTVGFRELGEVNNATKLFTIVYLITGLGLATYAISNLTALIVEGDLQGYLRERRMEKRLATLRNHIIVCGFGKMGFQAAWELKQVGVPFLVIEKEQGKGLRQPRFEGDIFLYGNAMDELILEQAGITRARGLITALTTDADNVMVTLTAKQLAPDVPIVARSAQLGTENKLKAAGANHIVSPYEIGGRRMAALLLDPALMDYVDVVLDHKPMEMAIEHIQVQAGSQLVGLSMREARLRDTTGALVVGIHRTEQGLLFNPRGNETFQTGDVLLAMGSHETLNGLVKVARGETRLAAGIP